MKTDTVKKLTLTALFMALSCVATMVIKIPTTIGYANLGDGIVLLGAYFLGPLYGLLAGGVGSMLADLLSGYAFYAPGTLVIKGLVAWIGVMLARKLCKGEIPTVRGAVVGGVVAEVWMVFGYWAYETLILGNGAAAVASLASNGAQGAVGVIVSVVLFGILSRVPELRAHIQKG